MVIASSLSLNIAQPAVELIAAFDALRSAKQGSPAVGRAAPITR